MKKIYNILIISILCVSNAWSQDSLKVVSGDTDHGKNGKENPPQFKIILGDKDERTNIQERRVYKKQVDGNWEEVTQDYSNKNLSDAFAKVEVYRNRLNRREWQNETSTEDNPVEKKKSITKTFTVDSKDKQSINNQHGDVKVELWDKNEIKVDITITGYGSSDAKAQELLDNVEITDKREGDKISFKTFIDSDNNNWNWGNNWSWNGKKEDESCNCPKTKKGVEVNYTIHMPRTNALIVSNKYGKTIIPQFDAPLRVTSNYGSFTSDRLKGIDKDIFVQYGSGNIKQMDDGDLQISYSKLNIDKADNLKLKNNYGSVTLDDINNLDGTFQYSSGKI